MADSLRDQLLKSGLVQKLKAEARPVERTPVRAQSLANARPPQKKNPAQQNSPRGPRPPRSQEEIDLARAYALRDRADREQRDQEKQQAEKRAREKSERKQKLATLLNGKSLNRQEADVPRHFPHGDKIRRVYCTAEQLVELNRGALAVAQHLGRYLLVTREVGEQVRGISPEALVLLCDPDAPAEDDIPADLIW